MSEPDTTSPVLLVAGGSRVDAGKTTFSAGLIAALTERIGDALGVKPRAGNDYWYDHDDYRAATGSGRLYGKDARRLAAASSAALEAQTDPSAPESINPIHRLWRPTPGRTGILGESGRTVLCDRVTTAAGPAFVVNGVAEAAGLLPSDLVERLPLSNATRVGDVAEFNEVMAATHLPALDRLAAQVAAVSVPVVIESYADIAGPLPLDGPVDLDAVAIVDPGRVRIYTGDRYENARRVASGSPREGSREELTDVVTELIEPTATLPLPAVDSDERRSPERIATRYSSAYDALLEAA